MASLDTVSIAILLGSLLVLAGILSSLIALRFGAPLLLVFLLVGMLAGEGGPGGLKFDDVRTAYTVGSIALALILFDGGLRTRLATFRNVLAPAVTLATVGVLITTLLTAPVAKLALGLGWIQALLVGAVVASTDAAAVFLLINAGGLRLRPRVRATLEVESGTNDPFAVFLVLAAGRDAARRRPELVARADHLCCATPCSAASSAMPAAASSFLCSTGVTLAQGLHAPFVAVGAVVIFAFANALHASGFLAVYLAGLVVGNRQTRAHNSIVAFLDAATWLAQIVMFVLLGLLVWPHRLADTHGRRHLGGAGADADRAAGGRVSLPRAVQFSVSRKSCSSPGSACAAPSASSLPRSRCWSGLPAAYLYFDVAFVVVLSSLLVQGWTVALAARKLGMSFARNDPLPRRVELDLPGQLEREIVGYPVARQQPVPAPRADPELGAADAGRAQARRS